jgi:ABC-2 type transport system ATP-binding protein
MGGFTAFRVGELIKYLGRFYPRGPGEIPAWLLNWAELDMKARVKSLSGGQKQRLSILLAMRHEPDLLVLDEPVASLDLQARLDFMGLLSEYCAKEERSAIISSHILSDLEKMVTRAIFMRRGAVVHDTPMKDFRRTTRWVSAPVAMEVLRAALPKTLSLLAEARESGALLVNGWNADVAGALHQALGVAVVERQPDLETAFLEMTR